MEMAEIIGYEYEIDETEEYIPDSSEPEVDEDETE